MKPCPAQCLTHDNHSIKFSRKLPCVDKFIIAFLENLGFNEFEGGGRVVSGEGRSNGYQRREEEIVKSEKKAEKRAYGTGKTLSSL